MGFAAPQGEPCSGRYDRRDRGLQSRMVRSIRALAARAFWSVAVPLDPQQLTKMHGECRMAGRPPSAATTAAATGATTLASTEARRLPRAPQPQPPQPRTPRRHPRPPRPHRRLPSQPALLHLRNPLGGLAVAPRIVQAAGRARRGIAATNAAQFIGRFCHFGHNLPIDWTKSAGIRAGRGRRARSCPALQHVHLRDSLGKVGPPDPEVLPIHADAVDRLGLVTRVSAGAPHEDDSVA